MIEIIKVEAEEEGLSLFMTGRIMGPHGGR